MSRSAIPAALSRAMTAVTPALLAAIAAAAVSPLVVTPSDRVARSGTTLTVAVPVTLIVPVAAAAEKAVADRGRARVVQISRVESRRMVTSGM